MLKDSLKFSFHGKTFVLIWFSVSQSLNCSTNTYWKSLSAGQVLVTGTVENPDGTPWWGWSMIGRMGFWEAWKGRCRLSEIWRKKAWIIAFWELFLPGVWGLQRLVGRRRRGLVHGREMLGAFQVICRCGVQSGQGEPFCSLWWCVLFFPRPGKPLSGEYLEKIMRIKHVECKKRKVTNGVTFTLFCCLFWGHTQDFVLLKWAGHLQGKFLIYFTVSLALYLKTIPVLKISSIFEDLWVFVLCLHRKLVTNSWYLGFPHNSDK